MKRLKNIEGKNKDQLDEIKYQGQKQLDVIKEQGKKSLKSINEQEKQLKKKKNQKKKLIEKIEREDKSEKIALLRNNLDNIFMLYDLNISIKGKNILKKRADDERSINYKNLFFKSGSFTTGNHDFFKRFGTLYDLLIDLLNEKICLRKPNIEQSEMIAKIVGLENFALSEEKINRGTTEKGKTKTQKRKTISIQKSVPSNALRLYDKRGDIIDIFVNKNILPGDLEEDVYRKEEPEYEESLAERTKMRRQNQQSAKGLRY